MLRTHYFTKESQQKIGEFCIGMCQFFRAAPHNGANDPPKPAVPIVRCCLRKRLRSVSSITSYRSEVIYFFRNQADWADFARQIVVWRISGASQGTKNWNAWNYLGISRFVIDFP